jgi:hypothetical protein
MRWLSFEQYMIGTNQKREAGIGSILIILIDDSHGLRRVIVSGNCLKRFSVVFSGCKSQVVPKNVK